MEYINKTQENVFKAIEASGQKFNPETVTCLWQSNGSSKDPVVYVGFNGKNPSSTGVKVRLRDISIGGLKEAGIQAWPFWDWQG